MFQILKILHKLKEHLAETTDIFKGRRRYCNHNIKAKPKDLPPVIHKLQVLSVAYIFLFKILSNFLGHLIFGSMFFKLFINFFHKSQLFFYFCPLSYILLRNDIDDAAGGEPEGRNDGQRHERQRHKRIDPLVDAKPERGLLG